MDDSAEYLSAGDGAIVDLREWKGAGDRLSEVQATVWTSLVVVTDVLVEHRLEMSS
jgi:regulator of sigma D